MKPRSVDVLLLGGGVAAARCARTLRRQGFGGSILLVSSEQTPPYNRPPLSKELLREDLPSELVLAEPMSWYERRAVELALGTPAVALDPDGRTVELADGQLVRFGQLLLATGAEPRRPPIPGAEHVRLLRTLRDAESLRAAAVAGARAVVVGGGFIGVEVASSLAARRLSVTLLERSDGLWGGNLGPALTAWAAEQLRSAGIGVRMSTGASICAPDAVWVGDEALPADVMLAGVGVTPRVELAQAAGLEVDDGVLVGDGQQTSASGIFAAGDMARPRGGMRIEHWHAARETGERAALAMLQLPVPARRAPWVFSEVAGATLDVVGSAPAWDEIVTRDGVHAYMVDGRVAQLAVINGALPIEEARAFVEAGGTFVALDELLARHNTIAPGVEES
jgi:NADPH-dependent 2,4-dienoyl-CoA reductase/sulfur reductase-like enzyme